MPPAQIAVVVKIVLNIWRIKAQALLLVQDFLIINSKLWQSEKLPHHVKMYSDFDMVT